MGLRWTLRNTSETPARYHWIRKIYEAVPGIDRPEPIIARYGTEVQAILADPAVRADFARQGTEPMPTTPTQFAEIIARDVAKWRRVVRDAGITPD